jgi:hypothetical protein
MSFLRKMVRLSALVGAFVFASPSTRASSVTSYSFDLATTNHIEHFMAFDEGPGGFERTTALPDVTGPGPFTLVNPNVSADPVGAYFLLGLTTDETGTHTVISMSAVGISNLGTLFSTTFSPFHETDLKTAILSVTSGLPASDPSVIAGYSTLNSFKNAYHNSLFAPAGDPATLVKFTGPAIISVPVPNSVAGGSVLMALLMLAYVRQLARRTCAVNA